MSRTIAVLTSGGDAPGMNAAIRAVVRKGIYCEARVLGIKRGFVGLVKGEFVEMEMGSVADIIHRGGTILRTGRSAEFQTEEGQKVALAKARSAGIDGLVVLGGDGSLRGALRMHELGIPTVGVPATIDNDIPCSEMSIGFDTAINTIVDAINKIRDTATSHERTFIVEVMGRNTGHIALAAGLAGGAESILIPEIPADMEEVCARLLRGYARGKLHSIIVVAEGVASGGEVAREVERRTGLETRTIVLGHIQRGGSPSALDRILASRMGALAVDLLLAGQGGRVMALAGGAIRGFELGYALSSKKDVDGEVYALAGILAR